MRRPAGTAKPVPGGPVVSSGQALVPLQGWFPGPLQGWSLVPPRGWSLIPPREG